MKEISRAVAGVGAAVSGIHSSVTGMETAVDGIRAGVQAIALSSPLSKLAYAEGASWDIGNVCQGGTRGPILAEIMGWIGNFQANGTARIFCLTGAPGAGKSTIAHSVAKMCKDNGWLASAFFFNREVSVRTGMLISTIACDLAARFPIFKSAISQAIDQDPGIASASSLRQFQELIIPFCSQLPQGNPIVIVLDALDEGFSEDLIEILEKGMIVSRLPGVFQFVVTSRNVVGIKQLLAAPHVSTRSLITVMGGNLEDVVDVIHGELGKVAVKKDLVAYGWPTREIEDMMKKRSGGLMIWVMTVCQYLRQDEILDPQSDLQAFLDRSLPEDWGAEEQMDQLYATILQQWKWTNRFTAEFGQIMGTVLVSKIPLSALAIEALHSGKVKAVTMLQLLKPLLLPSNEGQPIQILHQSLHDFLTGRALAVESWKVFAIDEKLHNQDIALQCINIINTQLSQSTPGTGYLQGGQRGMPKISYEKMSEHLSYACRFWMGHLIEVSEPHAELVDALHILLEQKFVLWLELSACKWQTVLVKPFIAWINVSIHLVLCFKASNEYTIIDLVHPSSNSHLFWRACNSIQPNQSSPQK